MFVSSSCPALLLPPSADGVLKDTVSAFSDPACIVAAHAASHAAKDEENKYKRLPVPDLVNLSFSLEELGKEQPQDSTLKKVFASVSPDADVLSAAHGYFVRKWILMCKSNTEWICWVNLLFRLLCRLDTCGAVLRLLHDQCGHSGV